MKEAHIEVTFMNYQQSINEIAGVLCGGKTSAVTNSENGVVRIWEGRTSFDGYFYDGHVDSGGRNLSAHIQAGFRRHEVTAAILRMLSTQGKKAEMEEKNGVEIYIIM